MSAGLIQRLTITKPDRLGALPEQTLVCLQAILHSLCHTESWAVDLSWDIIARFGIDRSYQLPDAFFDDFVAVAADEGRHFAALAKRLQVHCRCVGRA